MRTRRRSACSLALALSAASWAGSDRVSAQSAPAVTAADCELSVVRVHFSNKRESARLFVGFEGAIRETNYAGGYHLMAVTKEQRAQLGQSGYRIEDEPAVPVATPSGARGLQAPAATATAAAGQPATTTPAAAPAAAAGGIPYQSPTYSCFRTVDETFAAARQMVANHPTLATWVDIGDSWVKTHGGSTTDPTLTGDDMMTLVLTNSAVVGSKPKLFIVSSVHADEIAPMELTTRFAEYLVEHHGTDADATWILDHNEIHLLLAGNPDSRRLNEAGRGIRKNRNDSERDQYCDTIGYAGVDINRNFSYMWGQCDAQLLCSVDKSPCGFTYQGSNAGSEPETQAVIGRLQQLFTTGNRTGLFIDIHSYLELVMWPWGYTATPSPDDRQLQTLGRKLAHYNEYYPEASYQLYGTSGTTTDFAYGTLGVPAFTFEVGKTKWENCAYFESDILPKNLNALVYAAKVARNPYNTPAGPGATSVALSKSVVLDNAPVTLTAAIDDRQFGVYGIEAAQRIAAAQYTIDAPPWAAGARAVAMAATDGTFGCRDDLACATHATEAESLAAEIRTNAASDNLADDPCKNGGAPPAGAPDPSWYVGKCQAYFQALEILQEPVKSTIQTRQLSIGRHLVYVRGQDSDGNWGPVSATFLTKTTRGDVNADGQTDIVDALMVAQAYVNATPPGFYADAADVNCDGKADIVDALMIAQHYVGIITTLPTCSG